MSYSLNCSKGNICQIIFGTAIGLTKGDTRSSDPKP